MTREAISLVVPDVSAFARRLRAELLETPDEVPGHQKLLGLIARAGGFRNFQQLRATQVAAESHDPVDGRLVSRALARFDDDGRLAGWSSRRKVRVYCLWALWAQVPPRTEFSEKEISALFDSMSTLGDAAQIRRSLIEDRLLKRERDGSRYQRVEASPDPTARAIIATVAARRRAAPDR